VIPCLRREWRKSIFWLRFAEGLDPNNITIQKQYGRLYGKLGDKIAFETTKAR